MIGDLAKVAGCLRDVCVAFLQAVQALKETSGRLAAALDEGRSYLRHGHDPFEDCTNVDVDTLLPLSRSLDCACEPLDLIIRSAQELFSKRDDYILKRFHLALIHLRSDGL